MLDPTGTTPFHRDDDQRETEKLFFGRALVAAGYRNLVALDVSAKALNVTRERLGAQAEHVEWIVADITEVQLPPRSIRIWHDRAVFHFLIDAESRRRYVDVLRNALVPGGIVIIATFAPDGPTSCSGLEVARYSAEEICTALGDGFGLLTSEYETHVTPGGTEQRFVYACCRKD